MEPGVNSADDQYAGVGLAAASVLSIVAMAHHPSGPGPSGLNQLVHGAMIAVVLVSVAGFIRLAMRIGLHRFFVLMGLVAYCTGAGANMLAATINGFVVPSVFAHSVSDDILRLCWEFNQALAYGAAYAVSAAFALWGLELARVSGLQRIFGLAGVVVGLVTAALLAVSIVRMNVAGALVVYVLQAAFGVLAGAELMRARGSASGA